LPTVCEPATIDEAAAALADASTRGLRVGIGNDRGNIKLTTRRLTRLLEHKPGDLTAIVEAGICLSELDAVLERHGQMLALDPPGDPTIGACLAADLSGPRRHRYGTSRDLVLGVTVVLADGMRASSGGRVVKNVAGYDLGKLFCGSRGRLGLIARVALRLHPRPRAQRTLVVPVADASDAQRRSASIGRSHLEPTAVDLLWPGRIAVLFEGGDRVVEEQVEEARALVGGREDEAVWAEVAGRQLASRGRESFRPGLLAEYLVTVGEAIVRVGAGVAYVRRPLPDARPDGVRTLEERVRREFDPLGTLI
jgi:glycolate oxidase FAD binding subunit